MKDIEEYSEDIYKCSKCALCQSVCPIYDVTKEETSASRGKFILLNGVLQKKIELTSSVIKNVEQCLNCNACKRFCPSNIDAKAIFSTVKNEYNKKNIIGRIFYSKLSFLLFMNLVKIFANMYRLFAVDKFLENKKEFIFKFGVLGKRLLLLNSMLSCNVEFRKTPNNIHTKKTKVVFFEGCFNRYINPSSKNATYNLLQEMGYEVTPINQECCAIHWYYGGYFSEFEKSANNILETIPNDVDYIVCDCASCVSVLKSYDDLLSNDNKIADKVVELSDLLVQNNYTKSFDNKLSYTFHKPCHSDKIPNDLFKKLESCTYNELSEKDSCCGLSGKFALQYQNISRKISLKKAEDIYKTDSDVVVTSCPACVIGLNQGLIEKGTFKKVLNLSEFLNID